MPGELNIDHAVHSGKYGGPVPDALTAMGRLIATLPDTAGNVAVRGLHLGSPHAVEFPETVLREIAISPRN